MRRGTVRGHYFNPIQSLTSLWWPSRRRGPLVARREPEGLAIIEPGPVCDRLRTIFGDAGWHLSIASNVSNGMISQQKDPAPVLLCDRDLAGCDWREVISTFSKSEACPYIILLSRRLEPALWDELIRNGGSDMLAITADRGVILGAVEAGWLHWRSQQRLRIASTVR